MANKPRGEVAIEFGGKSYTLRTSMRALAEMLDKTKCEGLADLMLKMTNPHPADTVELLIIASRTAGDEIPKDVILDADVASMTEALEKLAATISPDDGDGEDPTKAASPGAGAA